MVKIFPQHTEIEQNRERLIVKIRHFLKIVRVLNDPKWERLSSEHT